MLVNQKPVFNQKLRPQLYRPSNEHLNGKEAELISFVLRLPFAIDGNRSQRKGAIFRWLPLRLSKKGGSYAMCAARYLDRAVFAD